MLLRLVWGHSRTSTRTGGAVGFFAALFGIGCSACGPLLGATLLTSIGGATLVSALPFGGQEIGYVGIGLLLFSAYTVSQNLQKPLVC